MNDNSPVKTVIIGNKELFNEEINDKRVRILTQYGLSTLFLAADRNANDPAS
jgi:hypothetical protein